MILKIFKVVWFVSLLAMTLVFIYCYASWPQIVSLSEEAGGSSVDRGILFYSCLGLSGVFNALSFLIVRMGVSQAFTVWFYGLLISFHTFLISIFIFITIFNSLEKYDYSRVGPTIYASMGLLMLWIAAWPVYYFTNRHLSQSKIR